MAVLNESTSGPDVHDGNQLELSRIRLPVCRRCANALASHPTLTTMKFIPLALLLLAPLASAQTYSGTLGPNDLTREGGAYYDAFTFQARMDEMVKVRMTGTDFDTYLLVVPPSDGQPFTNDDFDGVSVSQIEFLAREQGTYTIQASAYSSGLTGAYEVEVTLGPIANVEAIEGRLVPGDEQAIKGEYYDEISVQGGSGGQISFELLSFGFDGFLVVRSPSGQLFRNDDAMGVSFDGGGARMSIVEPMPNAAGRWTVYATSLSPDEVGAYDLRIIRTD